MEVAPWNQTKWLVASSFFFLVPAYYALTLELFSYSILLVFTSFISANYWRHATFCWRRDLDLFFAKMSFTIFVVNGVVYIRYVPYLICSYSLLVLLSLCYYFSGKLLHEKHSYWYKYHFLFHMLMTFELFMIVDSIKD